MTSLDDQLTIVGIERRTSRLTTGNGSYTSSIYFFSSAVNLIWVAAESSAHDRHDIHTNELLETIEVGCTDNRSGDELISQ